MLLSWAVQRGTAVIPKTCREDRAVENLGTFTLNDGDFKVVDSLAYEIGNIRYLDPSGHIGFDIFNEHDDEPVLNSAPWC